MIHRLLLGLALILVASLAGANPIHPDTMGYEAIYAKQMPGGVNMVHSRTEPFEAADSLRRLSVPDAAVNVTLVLDTSTYQVLEYDMRAVAQPDLTVSGRSTYVVDLLDLDPLENVTLNRLFVMYWMDGSRVPIAPVTNATQVRVMAEPMEGALPDYDGWPLLAMPRGQVLKTYASNVIPVEQIGGSLTFEPALVDARIPGWALGFLAGALASSTAILLRLRRTATPG